MTYEVSIQDAKTAIIEQTDRDDRRNYLYFFIKLENDGDVKKDSGAFLFKPLSHVPRVSGDPRGFESVGCNFHGKRAIERRVEASSLEEACTKFFAEWGDKFVMTGHIKETA